MRSERELIAPLLQAADIRTDGSRPWDLRVHDERLFNRVLADGTLGLGEAYVEGWWDCDHLDQFADHAARANLRAALGRGWRTVGRLLWARTVNLQNHSRAALNVQAHYDRGNLLYRAMLDRRMIYSCALWAAGVRTLDEAQEAKLELICRKLDLRPGMRVLDVGCGWGGLARYMAERLGVHVVGITLSREQLTFARESCAGLPVEIRLQDFREVRDSFNRIVSVGMLEHVGHKNIRACMRIIRGCLHDDGLCLLHTIGGNRTVVRTEPWIDRYIFPGTVIPSANQIGRAVDGLLVMEDWQNLGPHYDPTLMAWARNFESAWDRLHALYDERFRRMWRYYLLTCAGLFRARAQQVWQIVLSPRGLSGGYHAVR